MKLTRRTLVKWLTLSGIIALLKPLPVTTKKVVDQIGVDVQALTVYIDLLMPKDELPGAIELGVDKLILQKIEQNNGYAKTLSKGAGWLNYLARVLGAKDFASLNIDQQLKVVSISETSPTADIANIFYLTVRHDVFQLYYSHPEIVKNFHYAQPPQPLGFLDFVDPPIP